MLKRNDYCWCGSGKKYKKCHLNYDLASTKAKGQRPPGSAAKYIKNQEEIDGMRRAGEFNGQLMDYLRSFIAEGISTMEIDRVVYDYTVAHGHRPAPLGYRGFPHSVCTSINDVVCHGIPSSNDLLKSGDIINIDITTIVNGFHGDSSETFLIGDVSPQARHLVWVTAEAMLRGIAAVRPGAHLREIAESIEPFVISNGCSVVRQYTGHGIGRNFHEYFTVYHHRTSDCEDVILEPGMTLTIEPMVNLGSYEVVTDTIDKWTVRTKDGSLSAQFEHTVLVTEDGAEVLTLTPSQKAAGKVLVIAGIVLKNNAL